MEGYNPIFAGIDILRASGRVRETYVYAALDSHRELLALGNGDRDEVLAYFGGQAAAYVAINAPRQPNTGAVSQANLQGHGLLTEHPDQPANMRLCEHLLQALGFKPTPTPDTVTACPGWVRKGFSLYQGLKAFGYQIFPQADGPHQLMETHSEAVFWRLLKGKTPLPNSLEGRLQRQLILHSIQMPVPDAMDFFLEITRFKLIQGELPDQDIHTYEELNALAAAHIAWQAAHEPASLELLGDPDEGQIALPVFP
ncbi:MAG: DUF429 domain-containing protein [Brevefilum sp.]|nr:DUF429 domain-containing protein [Brevefilum sp.]